MCLNNIPFLFQPAHRQVDHCLKNAHNPVKNQLTILIKKYPLIIINNIIIYVRLSIN